MKNNLRVTNMVMTGSIPVKRKLKLDEMNKLIKQLNWVVINEECSPILQKKILREGKLSVHHKEKGILLCLWSSGAVNITGILNKREGNEGYERIICDLKKATRKIFKMNLRQAVEEVLKEDPRTREKFYDWLFLVKVLEKLGFHIEINFNSKMPHHESITRMRRKIMNDENKFNPPLPKEELCPRFFWSGENSKK